MSGTEVAPVMGGEPVMLRLEVELSFLAPSASPVDCIGNGLLVALAIVKLAKEINQV